MVKKSKYMGRREIRRALEHIFSTMVDELEWATELNNREWAKETGVDDRIKPVDFIKVSVSFDTANGHELVVDKEVITIPERYRDIK